MRSAFGATSQAYDLVVLPIEIDFSSTPSPGAMSDGAGASLRADDERLWPAQCCVPAFLYAAVSSLAQRVLPEGPVTRRALARLMGVTLSPDDANPWGLPTSSLPSDWGVSPAQALEVFPAVAALLGAQADLVLGIRPMDEIPFRLYEDELLELGAKNAVVAVSFDHAALRSRMGRSQPRDRAHHVARLTPMPRDSDREPTIFSPAFGLDYEGPVWLFDDSGELSSGDALVDWASLVLASRTAGGGFWTVHSG